jgi:hypothetical protein
MPDEQEPAPPQTTQVVLADEFAALKQTFGPFLRGNPSAQILAPTMANCIAVIVDAWSDESVLIDVPPDHAALAEALNALLLPERFSAVWHSDTRQLEVIWTALPMPAPWDDIPGRRFVFRFGGHEHVCEFGPSSVRLLKVTEHFRPARGSSTNFRNLMQYRFGPPDGRRPLSFWVSNIDWSEDAVVDLANNLNFYLTYYDAMGPYIVIHSPKEAAAVPRTRYITDSFPVDIEAREIDDPLLILWLAARTGDNARRFLYYYRIIEFASFTYLEQKARTEVRRVIASPHARSDIAGITNELMEALQKAKLDDFQKGEALMKDTVRPALLWREIHQNLGAFSVPTDFDGGFRLDPLVPANATESQFEVKGVENFFRATRDLRNALSHGKDSRSAGAITPTARNFAKLHPWVSAISVAAAEVMLYRNAS